ncbi:hypothetical protein ACLB2K_051137 [Fragaria x ananassa]
METKKSRETRMMSDDAKRRQLMELPMDTLVDILLRLPAKTLGRIRCVSRTLLKMVNNISFSTLHTSLLIATNSAAAACQVPQLMCCFRSWIDESDECSVTLQSLKYNEENALTKDRYAITISSQYYVCFVFCNLFCLQSNDNGECLLINPLGEREVVRLPENSFVQPLEDGGAIRNCWLGMGFDNKTNTYKIPSVTHDSKFDDGIRLNYMTAQVLVLGTDSWREIPSLPPRDFIMADQVCANGDVHWLTYERCKRIISFDFTREEFYCIPIPPTLQRSRNSDSRLLTLKGSLAIVETTSSNTRGMIMNIEIWVLKDLDEKQWLRYYKNSSIPDSIPFESYGAPREWEHGIFFTRYSFWEVSVFFLDLRYGSVNRAIYSLCRNESYMSIRSYTESLISLKDYGNLEDAHEVIA